jgi:23S rRNA (guanosine2251-2'-O)-methyltransferase
MLMLDSRSYPMVDFSEVGTVDCRMMRDIIIIAHDIRSSHNVGSLLRTAEGLGITKVFCTGYTPYPAGSTDSRLPHLALKIDRQIHKTALGAEKNLAWEHRDDVLPLLTELKANGYTVAALEQSTSSIALPDFTAPQKVALMIGREVEGIEQELLNRCDTIIEIPMSGKKESFNVVQAAAMALYHLRFF